MTTRLRELLGKATKGPWTYSYEGSGDFQIYGNSAERASFVKKYSDENDVVHVSGPDSCFMAGEESEYNAALIVEAVNTLPALLDALDEARGALEGIKPLWDVDCPVDGDDEHIGWQGDEKLNNPIPVTFGQIRAVIKALAKINEVIK